MTKCSEPYKSRHIIFYNKNRGRVIRLARPKNLVSPPVGVALRRSGRILSPPYIPRGGLKLPCSSIHSFLIMR